MVDDEAKKRGSRIALAQSYNIDVYVFTSTASAKTWIDANEGKSKHLTMYKYY